MNDKTVILYDNTTYKVSSMNKIRANGRDMYVFFNDDHVKKIAGETYIDGDIIALLEETQLVTEAYSHWSSLAKGIVLHCDYTVNKEAMTRVNNLVFRCWDE
jgi:hypothetical protein